MLTQFFVPFITGVDNALALVLPLWLRLLVWGIGAGMAAVFVYSCLSPQRTIAWLKQRSRELRKQMMDLSLSGQEFTGLIKENLRTSLGLLGRVTLPALISAVPVLLLAFWIVVHHGYQLPAADEPMVLETDHPEVNLVAKPAEYVQQDAGHRVFIKPEARGKKLTLLVGDTTIYDGRPFEYAVPTIHKKHWWNTIAESSVGYLKDQSPVDQVQVFVTPTQVIPGIPSWLSRWEWIYFLGVFAGALGMKWKRGIE